MLKLIRLEWKKNQLKKYIYNIAIMAVGLLILLLYIIGGMDMDGVVELCNENTISVYIELFTYMAYMVFAGNMFASFVVDGYKNKTLNLMFSYSIKRKTILLAQMISVWIFNVIALILTKILLYEVLIFNKNIVIFRENFYNTSFWFRIIISSIMVINICFIALLIGIYMKSSKATIISSFLLAYLTQRNVVLYIQTDNLLFYIAILILSLISIYLSIYRIEIKDI